MSEKIKKYSLFEIVILTILVAVAVFVWIGFFGKDPYAAKRFGMVYFLVLWCMRLGVPFLIITALYFYHGVKKGKVSGGNIALIVMGIVIAGLLCYPLLNFYYNVARIKDRIVEYHPYLQLNPVLPDGQIRKDNFNIICLGGSTTEFKDSKKRGWPDRVQELLVDRTKKENIRVYNLGRQWYTTLHTLINYETNIRVVKPDVMIVMHGINDFYHNADFSYSSHGSFRDDYGHFYGPVDILITGHSFIKAILDRIDFWYYKPREVVDQRSFPGLVPFERNLNSLIDLAEIDNVKILLMTQPNIYKEKMSEEELNHINMFNKGAFGPDKMWSPATAVRGMDLYNESIREIAKERNIPLIDLEKEIPKSLEFFYDEVHYRDKTFDIIAEYVAGELATIIGEEAGKLGSSSRYQRTEEREDKG